MTDYSFNTIIDTSTLQIGQVVRINFTDDGIFRVFYNDSNGNMYCGLSRQSNYKQVIADSAHKRTQIDISSSATDNIALNKFNPPIYGGTYHEEQTRIPIDRNDKNFYVFKYDTPGVDLNANTNNSNHGIGPWWHFSEIQNQIYIKQGNTSGSIYNSDGYSSVLAAGKNPFATYAGRPHPDYNFYNQYGFCTGSVFLTGQGKVYTKGIGIPFPDTLDLYGQTVNNITNKPLNTNYSYLSNLSDISIESGKTVSRFTITTVPFSETIGTNPELGTTGDWVGGGTAAHINYTVANKRSKYVWLDENNHATPFADGTISTTGAYDTYYKGNFYIYAHTNQNGDLSGNVYIERRSRRNTTDPIFIYKAFTNFANTANLHQGDINSIFVDLDLDISKNSTINSGNFNYIYSRPYYVICSDLSGQIVHGTIPFDLSGDSVPLSTDQHIVNINGYRPNVNSNDDLYYSNGTCAKYCKIMVDPTSTNWKTTRYHIIYYAIGGPHETSHTKNTLRWVSGEGKSAFDLCGNITNIENSGLYPSMDMSGNVPYVAYLCKGTDTPTDFSGIGYSYLKSDNTWTDTIPIATRGDLGGDNGMNRYLDVSNNHPISLKISPYDYSIHICYQKFNTNGSSSIGYWSNSKNTMDISGIDASLNFLGIKSYGKTIGVNEASVELFWDLSQCNCIFSRDYTRLDENGNTIGLTTPQTKIKIQGYPEGGRNGDFVKSIDEDGVITYRASELDKLFTIIKFNTGSFTAGAIYLFTLGKVTNNHVLNSAGDVTYFYLFYNNIWTQFGRLAGDNALSYYKNGSNTPIDSIITLNENTNYELQYYLDRTNYYLFIDIKNLDNDSASENGKYEAFNINAATPDPFNRPYMNDGLLSIGNGAHEIERGPIRNNFTIYKISMYATDISNIPVFDVSRNGEILDDCTGTHFSSFFDNSGNTGLVIEPSANIYQIVNAVNSLNNGDISGSSYDKSVMLNDIYYLQQIEGYSQSSYGAIVKGISNFYDGEIWAHGYVYNDVNKNSKSTVFWRSTNNGLSWIRSDPNISGFANFTINNIATFVDDFLHPNGVSGKWIYFSNENNIYFTSNYVNQIPTLGVLGDTWNNFKVLNPQPFSLLINKGFTGISSTNSSNTTGLTPLNNPTESENNDLSWNFVGYVSGNVSNTFTTTNSGYYYVSKAGNNPTGETTGTHNACSYIKFENLKYPDPIYIDYNISSELAWDYLRIIESDDDATYYIPETYDNSSQYSEGAPGDVYSLSPGWRKGYSGEKKGTEKIKKKYFIVMFHKDGSVDRYNDNAKIKIYSFLTESDITYLYPTLTNNTISNSIFNIDMSANDFHLFVGYKDADTIIRMGKNRLTSNNFDISSNIMNDNFTNLGDINAISFGQPYRGVTDLSDNLNNLIFGIVGTNNYILTTNNGGKSWTKKLDYNQSIGTTGVYVGQNTKYGEGDSLGDHTYDINGFHVQTNSKPWVGYNGFLVADNNNNYDVSFSPMPVQLNNSISNPQLYNNNYWEPQTTSLYKLPNTQRDTYDNNYKVIISNFKNQNNKSGLKYQQNDIVFTQSSGDNNILYLKNSNYDHWQKIDVSPINKKYNISQLNSDRFTNIIPIDISKTVVYIEGYNSYNNISGFYTISKLPPKPGLIVSYPISTTDITRADLNITMDFNQNANKFDGTNNNINFINKTGDKAQSFKYDIETIYEYQEQGTSNAIWQTVPRNENFKYTLTLNILEQGKRYIFRCRLKNKYGFSEYSDTTREISIPAYDPFITNLSYRNKILENTILWKAGLTNQSQTVYAYDISKSYVDYRFNIIRDFEFDKKYYYNDISGVVGPYSFKFGELETVEWDETNSRDMSFNHFDNGRNLISAGSDVSGNTFSWYYGISKYVIEKKPEIYDISINFQNVGGNFEFGLSDNSNNYSNIMDEFHYCFSMGVNSYNLRENGDNIFSGWQSTTTYPNDVFTIQITKNNEVKYYINNILKYTSSNTPTYPLYILYVPYYGLSQNKGIFNVQATKINPIDSSNNWTSRIDSYGNEIFDISSVSFIDRDINFNTTYLYGIVARAIAVDGVVKTRYYETNTTTDNGIPEQIKYNYQVNNANLKLNWTKTLNISDDISTIWDISWNEKRKDGTENNGIISIPDSSFTFSNGGASYVRTLDYSGATNTYLQPNASYNFQIRGKYSKPNQSNLPTYISKFSDLLFYYNYQEPPILKDVSYNLQTNRINALWTEPKRPTIPDYYDISMVNITSKYDISYNFSQTLNSFSDNGLTYYPGTYKIQVRAVHNGGINLNTINNYKYQFTNCGATGRLGPTQSQCDASYNGTNVNVTINTQGIQEWTVPVSGSYKITAIGAAGGDNTAVSDSGPPQFKGGKVTGTFYLSKDDVYQILVGQKGEDSGQGSAFASGGGGATYIVKKSTSLSANTIHDILVVAGGGGGLSAPSTSNSPYGGTDALGFMSYGTSYSDTTGGVGSDTYLGGGGGGFSGNGDGTTTTGGVHAGGYSFKNGGMGGTKGQGGDNTGEGGFGGGGGASFHEAGSGGGFRGGDCPRLDANLGWPDEAYENGGGGYSYSSKRLNSTFVVNDVISHGSVSIDFVELGEQTIENTIVFPFTNCNAAGRFGPTQSQCNASYNGTNVSVSMTIPGIQEWIVPETGTYIINTKGAMGGWSFTGNPGSSYNPPSHPGYGAILEGNFYLTKGDIYNIAVGQKGKTAGHDSANGGGGGGGGTFVWKKGTTTPLIIAGGGGGQSIVNHTIKGRGENASLTENGNISSETWHDPSNVHGTWYPAGTNGGNGGTHSGASRGWNSIISDLSDNMPGRDLTSTYDGDGGFGGGGFNGSHGGGGGGGYSGGGSQSYFGGFPWDIAGGGGGGSYFNSVGKNRRDSTTLGYNQDNGSVSITLISDGTSNKSEWTSIKEFSVPYHSIKNLKITPYNKNNIKDLTDVSYIKLEWDDMIKCNLSDNFGINIPDNFTVIRQWSSKGFNYFPDYEKVISKDSVSYLDQEYPLGREITWPRQYKYDISGNYS